jgi:hypothetical protein
MNNGKRKITLTTPIEWKNFQDRYKLGTTSITGITSQTPIPSRIQDPESELENLLVNHHHQPYRQQPFLAYQN